MWKDEYSRAKYLSVNDMRVVQRTLAYDLVRRRIAPSLNSHHPPTHTHTHIHTHTHTHTHTHSYVPKAMYVLPIGLIKWVMESSIFYILTCHRLKRTHLMVEESSLL